MYDCHFLLFGLGQVISLSSSFPNCKNTYTTAGGVVQVAESLPSKHKPWVQTKYSQEKKNTHANVNDIIPKEYEVSKKKSCSKHRQQSQIPGIKS
jgi:hypothetical protein